MFLVTKGASIGNVTALAISLGTSVRVTAADRAPYRKNRLLRSRRADESWRCAEGLRARALPHALIPGALFREDTFRVEGLRPGEARMCAR
jgi:hypothetical protein